MASALIRCMHSLTVYLFHFFSSQHFTDNNDIITMLIAPCTAPHYHPFSKLTKDEAKLWFIDRTDGLGIPANALTAFQGEVSDPTDLIGLGDSNVNAIQRSLGTHVNTMPQAKQSLPSSSLPASYYALKVPSSWSTTFPWFEGTFTGSNSSGRTCATSCSSGMH
jgi:hypothetical protein